MRNFSEIIDFVRMQFKTNEFIPLHAPVFNGNEKKYVLETIDSTFVSSVGNFVTTFEKMMCDLTGAKYAVAVVNGTSALHMSLLLADVKRSDEVITQSLTFIATCNAISYIGAQPIFIDVDKDTLGMSPTSLLTFLEQNAKIGEDGFAYNIKTQARIKACVPMHTFGFPCRIDKIKEICDKYKIILIEDSAESIGSYYNDKHTGVFGKMGVFSFNGNKTITCGGGGAIIMNDSELAQKAKHLTTQAKVPHKWEFVHDSIGYNYRMPNLNAALACAQIEQLSSFISNKRELASRYAIFFRKQGIEFIEEIQNSRANYWLNAILLDNKEEREHFLNYLNENNVMSRPVWELMHRLPMFSRFQRADLSNSEWISDRLVNIPSSVRSHE